MRYRMIVSRALFDFAVTGHGRLRLRSVRFLDDSRIREKNNVLLVSEHGRVEFFLKGSTPVSHLSGEQFRFVAAAARFFGHLPDQERMPVWLWTDSLRTESDPKAGEDTAMSCCREGRMQDGSRQPARVALSL